jgi:hypothetical protein
VQSIPESARLTLAELIVGAVLTPGGHVTQAVLALTPRLSWQAYHWLLEHSRFRLLGLIWALCRIVRREIGERDRHPGGGCQPSFQDGVLLAVESIFVGRQEGDDLIEMRTPRPFSWARRRSTVAQRGGDTGEDLTAETAGCRVDGGGGPAQGGSARTAAAAPRQQAASGGERDPAESLSFFIKALSGFRGGGRPVVMRCPEIS